MYPTDQLTRVEMRCSCLLVYRSPSCWAFYQQKLGRATMWVTHTHTPQKAFTDRIGSWCMIRRFQDLDAACSRNTSESGPKLAIMITDEILRRVSIRSRLQ